MNDLVVLKEVAPIIECNFEQVKESLSANLEHYKNLVVTEEQLGFCKSEQKHLAGLRKKIDDYRKKIKKDMSAPITEFEGKCKELITLIEQTEEPIKDGIKLFDDERKEAKRQFALSEIERIRNELMLSGEYMRKFEFDEKWTNLTAHERDVSSEIYSKIELLLIKQTKDEHMLSMMKILVDRENETLISKIDYKDFYDVDNIISVKELEFNIKNKANLLRKREEEVKIKVIEQAEEVDKSYTHTPKIAPAEVIGSLQEKSVILLTYKMKMTGSKESLFKLKEFMKTLEMFSYEVVIE